MWMRNARGVLVEPAAARRRGQAGDGRRGVGESPVRKRWAAFVWAEAAVQGWTDTRERGARDGLAAARAPGSGTGGVLGLGGGA